MYPGKIVEMSDYLSIFKEPLHCTRRRFFRLSHCESGQKRDGSFWKATFPARLSRPRLPFSGEMLLPPGSRETPELRDELGAPLRATCAGRPNKTISFYQEEKSERQYSMKIDMQYVMKLLEELVNIPSVERLREILKRAERSVSWGSPREDRKARCLPR